MQARTNLVAMIDVDLVVNSGFVEGLAKAPASVEALEREVLLNRSMAVMSPFEAFDCMRPPEGREPQDGAITGVKAAQGPRLIG